MENAEPKKFLGQHDPNTLEKGGFGSNVKTPEPLKDAPSTQESHTESEHTQ